MKVLVVDDDQLTLKTIGHTLKEEGFDVSMAKDVSVALNVIKNEKIDLVISDIMMPDVSGLGLISLLKNFYLDNIPVILISSLNKKNIIASSSELGAAYFLTKPIDMNELLVCIKNIFNNK
jgi:DNA-binding response OmpR family regulator